MPKVETWQLKQRQGHPLSIKERLTENRIRAWYEHWKGRVYVSFSGGKDSTVLLDLVRRMYPSVVGVFVDTGLEYPEIREFVKGKENIVWLRPKMAFPQVIEKYGYPVVSKKVAMGVSRYANTTSDLQKRLRMFGGINPSSGKKQAASIPKKWLKLIHAPFKVSESCCDVMKKRPFHKFQKESGLMPMSGVMAGDSRLRRGHYMRYGCNSFEGKAMSMPMAFWLEKDIWAYIKKYDLPYSKIYDMGYSRTGCMFCMFGVHLEKAPNRFQRMRKTHPNQYNYCINKLGCGKVLDYIGVEYGESKQGELEI